MPLCVTWSFISWYLTTFLMNRILTWGYIWGLWEDKGTVFISEEKSRLRDQRCLVVSSDCTFGGRWLPVLDSVFLFGWVDMEHFHYPGISMWPERNSTHRQRSGGSPSSATHCLLTLTRSFIVSWASVSPLVGWKWPHSFWVTLLLSSLWLGSLPAPGGQDLCR